MDSLTQFPLKREPTIMFAQTPPKHFFLATTTTTTITAANEFNVAVILKPNDNILISLNVIFLLETNHGRIRWLFLQARPWHDTQTGNHGSCAFAGPWNSMAWFMMYVGSVLEWYYCRRWNEASNSIGGPTSCRVS
jgi:hypothetical protein